jgi:hypothetical protein
VLTYTLPAEQRFYRSDHNTKDSKAENAVLNPGAREVNHADVLDGWEGSGCFRIRLNRHGRTLDHRLSAVY